MMMTTLMALLPTTVVVWATENIVPTPTETPLYNDDDVTPGVVGFVFTALFAVAVILIGLDLYRRVRRVRYREEAREAIAAELAARDADGGDAPGGPEQDRR